MSRRATWLQLPRFPTPNGNVPAFSQTDFHLWRNGNLHFTLYLKGHGDSHTRKIGEPPTGNRNCTSPLNRWTRSVKFVYNVCMNIRKIVSIAAFATLATVPSAAMANPLPERIKGLAAERIPWRSVGPGGGGWIQSILWSRYAKDRLFVGCDVGGFYVSEDAGRHYEMRNRGLKHMYVETIAEHPSNPDILFLGTPGGIYKTTDRGLTWQEKRSGLPPISASSHSVQISKFAFAADNPNILYAAVGQPRTLKGARGEV